MIAGVNFNDKYLSSLKTDCKLKVFNLNMKLQYLYKVVFDNELTETNITY